MAHLVRCLDVHVDEVVAVLDRLDRGIGLAFVVCIDVARRARHLDDIESHRAAQPVDDVNGGHDCALDAVLLRDGMDRASLAAAPRPHAIRTTSLEDFGRLRDDVAENLRGILALGGLRARQMLGDGIAAIIVRLVVGDCRTAESGSVKQHEVAVAHARIETDVLAIVSLPGRGDLLVEKRNRLLLLGLADMPTREVRESAVRSNRGEVHAEDDVVRPHLNALACGLERTTSAQLLREIAAQHAHVGDVARRRESIGKREHLTRAALRGNPVHIGNIRGLKRRTPAEFGEGLVGHAIAKKEYSLCVFHGAVLYHSSAITASQTSYPRSVGTKRSMEVLRRIPGPTSPSRLCRHREMRSASSG